MCGSAGDLEDGGEAAVDVFVGGGPTGNADAHGGAAVPLGSTAPAGAFVLDFGDDATRFFGTAETYEDLVEHYLIQDFESGSAETVGETLGQATVAFDEVAESFAA